ncbi:MAG: hypothetical protein E2O50_05605 [Gammaproteobacteria bacterium]|nr:MAG: hypothetical protein E2O50_05605 [Gammaproteobacteria bacterium]
MAAVLVVFARSLLSLLLRICFVLGSEFDARFDGGDGLYRVTHGRYSFRTWLRRLDQACVMHSFAEPKHETNTGAQQLLPLLTHGKSSEIDLHLIIERSKLLSNQSFLNTIQFR